MGEEEKGGREDVMWAQDDKDGRVWEGGGGEKEGTTACRDRRSAAAMQ